MLSSTDTEISYLYCIFCLSSLILHHTIFWYNKVKFFIYITTMILFQYFFFLSIELVISCWMFWFFFLFNPYVSLRTTLCVRFKSEVVACGVVYAAARRFQVSLPENPPWWLAFDADQAGIEEVCRVLAHLYTLPKAQYIPVYKDSDSFTSRNKTPDPQAQFRKVINTN